MTSAHVRQTTSHQGCTLSWLVAGEGPPVVMIQGVGVGATGWLPQVEALSARFRCLCFDNRGFGASLPLAGELTAGQLRTATERIRVNLADVERQMADAGRIDVLGPLLAGRDVRAVWDTLDDDRRRAIIATIMTVTLMPPGRGSRTFRPETVVIEWRTA